MTHHVIGAGGVSSWLIPKLVRLEKGIIVYDGDTLEKKNLDRQLFDEEDVGRNKAQAMAAKYGILFVSEYYHSGLIRLDRTDWLWCCADNHAARREVLAACDLYRCRCLIGANEYEDSEALYYEPSFAGTPNDPRVIYPDYLTDRSGDPLGPPGCVELSKANRQLVIANAMAADLMLMLYWFHTQSVKKMPEDTRQYWPVHHKGNMLKLQTIRLGDRTA